MVEPATLLFFSFLLFCIGLYGLSSKRNMVRQVIALEVMTKGAILVFAGSGAQVAEPLIISVILVETVVAAALLSIAVRMDKEIGTLDTGALKKLKG